MRVADLILDILAAHGVRRVFGVPGDAINDITDALRQRDDMDFILVRHEEAGAFMASAEAKLTGRLAACVGTSGPGAIHLLNGLYDAKLDHAPVIAITGQQATEYIGTGYHQEVDLERLFSDFEYSRTVMTEDEMPQLMMEACKAALAAPGPAHISVPTDIAGRTLRPERCDFAIGSDKGETRPCESSLAKAARLIDEAEKVAILTGIGAADARGELLALSARLQAPIVRTLRAKDFIDEDVEACIGGLGLLGSSAGSAAVDNCDLLLIVGADYPYVAFYPKRAKIVQIESSPHRMGRRAAVDAPLHGHARLALKELILRVAPKSSDRFYTDMQKEKQKDRKAFAKAERSKSTPIRPQRAIADIAAAAPENAIIDGIRDGRSDARREYIRTAERRHLKRACPALLDAAGTGPQTVQRAAFDALRTLAGPEEYTQLIALAVAAPEELQSAAVRAVQGGAVVVEGAGSLNVVVVVGHQRAALAAVEVLRGLEAEAAHVAVGPDRLAAPLGQVGLAGVLDDGEAPPVGERKDRVEVRGSACDVHRHDGAGARRDGGLDLLGVDLVRPRVAVDEDGQRMVQQHDVDRRDEGVGRNDYLVTGADLQRGECGVERGGAAVGGQGVLGTEPLRPLAFEGRDAVAAAPVPLARAQRFQQALLVVGFDERPVREGRLADGRTAEHGGFGGGVARRPGRGRGHRRGHSEEDASREHSAVMIASAER